VQALGVSGSLVIARAVVRDLYEGARAGQQLSAMSVIMGLMPIAAPIVGGILITFWHWRAGFIFQFAAGAAAALLVWRFLPETQARTRTSFAALIAGYREIATHRVFLANLLVGCVGHCGLFAWIAGSSYVMQRIVGLTPFEYAICYGLSCVGFMIGGGLAARLVVRIGLDRTAGIGAAALTVGGLGMVAAVLYGSALPITMTLAMDFYLCGLGLLLPQMVAGALTPFPHHAGTASSLIGFTQQCGAALMATVVGHSLGATPWPVAMGAAFAGCGCLLLWFLTRQIRTSPTAGARH
jgi:DHA1 family bicyclomycin/chloramphenicol resistance-like MFS transporter